MHDGLGLLVGAGIAELRWPSSIASGTPLHDRGSSHGETRVIRLGYFEHPSNVPLLRAAYPAWRAIEARAATPLLTITGIVEIGMPRSELAAGTLASSRLHALAHDVLNMPGRARSARREATSPPSAGFPRDAALLGRARLRGERHHLGPDRLRHHRRGAQRKTGP
jgi:sarcosine oxidase